MNTIIRLPVRFILLFSACILLGCNSSDKQSINDQLKNTIVLVKYKTQPHKSTEAILELNKLINKVKQEPHFVYIKLHVDPMDNTNIMLYEEWNDMSYYNSEHMSTAHLKEFIEKSRDFLARPPEISLWNVESIFK